MTAHQIKHLSGAHQTLVSTKTLSNNTQIWYTAAGSVELRPGFEAPNGTQLRAYIQGCDPP
jgi:hypothetical protein